MTYRPNPAQAPVAMLSFTDPITARWPDDSTDGVLEDVIWVLSGEKGGVVDDLMLEKLALLRDALTPPAVTIYTPNLINGAKP